MMGTKRVKTFGMIGYIGSEIALETNKTRLTKGGKIAMEDTNNTIEFTRKCCGTCANWGGYRKNEYNIVLHVSGDGFCDYWRNNRVYFDTCIKYTPLYKYVK